MFRLDFLFLVSHTDLFLPLCIIICHPLLQTSFPWPSKKTKTESCDCFNENRRRCCDTISDAADVSHSLKRPIPDMGYLFLFRHLSYMPQDIQYPHVRYFKCNRKISTKYIKGDKQPWSPLFGTPGCKPVSGGSRKTNV